MRVHCASMQMCVCMSVSGCFLRLQLADKKQRTTNLVLGQTSVKSTP